MEMHCAGASQFHDKASNSCSTVSIAFPSFFREKRHLDAFANLLRTSVLTGFAWTRLAFPLIRLHLAIDVGLEVSAQQQQLQPMWEPV